jgi:hypothetical protein
MRVGVFVNNRENARWEYRYETRLLYFVTQSNISVRVPALDVCDKGPVPYLLENFSKGLQF